MASWANGLAESLFATLFPSDCRLCSLPLLRVTRLPVCSECLSQLRAITGSVCSVCGERLLSPFVVSNPNVEALCGECQKVRPVFTRAVSYGSYDSALRGLLHLLKYEQVRPAAAVLGRMLSEAIAHLGEPSSAEVLVIPVPLHRRKLRQRGFNQAELIVKAALKAGPWKEKLQLRSGVLERCRETRSQIGLTRPQRRENMRGAFVVVRQQEITGREILLVDDVFTTGTTVSECARVLRRAGASKVWVATVARTLKIHAHEIEFAESLPDEAKAG